MAEFKGYDINKLAHAVAWAETGHCKVGTGKSRNNCFGIKAWKNGQGYSKYYDKIEDSFEDFKRIWSKYYGRFPDYALAVKWTGDVKAAEWLKTVNYYYQK